VCEVGAFIKSKGENAFMTTPPLLSILTMSFHKYSVLHMSKTIRKAL
jgi:hypothetical protein